MNIKHILSAAAVASTLGMATSASAQVYPDFRVNPIAYRSATCNGLGVAGCAFTADKITGNYIEVVTFTPTSATAGTFSFALLFQGGQFVQSDGTVPLSAARTGLNSDYGLDATFYGTGTFSGTPGNVTFNLNPGGALTVFIDPGVEDTFAQPATGAGTFTTTSATADTTIATGAGLSGQGRITCIGGNNCGSFGQLTSFNLTNPAGLAYFFDPVPFYKMSLQSGQFNSFNPFAVGTQTLNGSMDIIFAVPEPASLALVGVALFAVGFGARRRKS